MFQRLENEGGIAVDFPSNGQHGDLAVGQVEVISEEWSRHHSRDGDKGVRDLFEAERQAGFEGEGGGVVAEEDYRWWLGCHSRGDDLVASFQIDVVENLSH